MRALGEGKSLRLLRHLLGLEKEFCLSPRLDLELVVLRRRAQERALGLQCLLFQEYA